MRFMPDSAVLGTIGHAKRRNAIARKRSARRNAGIANMQLGVRDYVGGIAMMFGFIVLVALFL